MKTLAFASNLSQVALALLFLSCSLQGQDVPPTESPPGIALALVYDTSGSMLEQVKDRSGGLAPKYRIASRALESIIERLAAIATPPAPQTGRPLECGLIVFEKDRPSMAVRFGKFDSPALQRWLKGFNRPEGSTPLGQAVELASQTVLASSLTRKHVLILTDGVNTRGPDPATVIPKLTSAAALSKVRISYHFVAFDVDAKEFARVKKLGATVVGAADEKQLNSQLEFILQEKILLEEEESLTPRNK